jgi:hypothetical protein
LVDNRVEVDADADDVRLTEAELAAKPADENPEFLVRPAA